MKELNMSWEEIKRIPRVELDGLLLGLKNYTTIHAFDGYNDKDISKIQEILSTVITGKGKSNLLIRHLNSLKTQSMVLELLVFY